MSTIQNLQSFGKIRPPPQPPPAPARLPASRPPLPTLAGAAGRPAAPTGPPAALPAPEWGFVSAPRKWRLGPWRPPPGGRPRPPPPPRGAPCPVRAPAPASPQPPPLLRAWPAAPGPALPLARGCWAGGWGSASIGGRSGFGAAPAGIWLKERIRASDLSQGCGPASLRSNL